MDYKEFKPKTNGTSKTQVAVTNVGSGTGLFRSFNGPLIELKTIDTAGGIRVSDDPDGHRIIIDGSSLKDEIGHLRTKVSELSTSLSMGGTSMGRRHDTLSARITQLENEKLPESLILLDQMPKFNGGVPVIENGKWAALNLSNDFFQKYETKITSINMDLDALTMDVTDIRENAEAFKLDIVELDTNARILDKMLSKEIKKVRQLVVSLWLIAVITAIFATIKVIL